MVTKCRLTREKILVFKMNLGAPLVTVDRKLDCDAARGSLPLRIATVSARKLIMKHIKRFFETC